MSARASFVPAARALAAALACVAASAPRSAHAQRRAPSDANASAPSVAEARALFDRGLAEADAERWGNAVLYFERSLALVQRTSTQINLGNALVRSGRPVEAERALLGVLEGATPPRERAQAQTMLAEARRAIVTLLVRIDSAGAGAGALTLSVDGSARTEAPDGAGVRTLRVNPGAHTLQARRDDGGAEGQSAVRSLPGATLDVRIELRSRLDARVILAPVPSTPPAAQTARRGVLASPVFWGVAGAVLAGGIATGVAFGLMQSPYCGNSQYCEMIPTGD